ncbi:MAG: DnaJ C-terminal domain-containing protein [Thainema sp.]
MAATDFKDYYAILGVGKSSNADEIKRAYRKLARKYHPDLNPGDKAAEARFKEVNEAYEVLSDPDKRQKYDQFGQYWKQAGQAGGWAGGAPGGVGGFDFSNYGSFDEFINELLGRFSTGGAAGGRSRTYGYSGSPRGAGGFSGFDDFATGFGGRGGSTAGASLDQEASISLTFSEAFHGAQKRLNLGTEVIDVRIPAGARNGSRIRVRGKGVADPMGSNKRGDLYLNVQLQPHTFFKLDGDNLTCEVPIAPDEAALGGSIDVPTPDGSVTMTIPAGIRSGQSLRLRGKGWPNRKGGRGDQLVRVQIVPPKTLSEVERECYEKIRDSRTMNPRSSIANIHL